MKRRMECSLRRFCWGRRRQHNCIASAEWAWLVLISPACGMEDYKEYLEMVLLTKNSHKDVVECSADQWLRFQVKKVNQTLKDIQFEPSIYGHIPQKLFAAAVRPCRMVGVVSVNVWDAIIIVLHCDSRVEKMNQVDTRAERNPEVEKCTTTTNNKKQQTTAVAF